jgi:ribosome-associated protein
MVPKCSREVEIVGPVDTATLVVAGLVDAQMESGMVRHELDRDEEASIEICAIRGDRVNLVCVVRRNAVAVLCATKGPASDDYGPFVHRRPLALEPHEAVPKSKNEVAPPTVRNGPIDLDPEFDCGEHYSLFRDRAFLIRCHVRQPSKRLGWAVSCLDSPGTGYHSPRRKETTETLSSLDQARHIAGLAEEKLASDIVILDMRPVCAYTDFFVVCSGQNPRQTKAILDEVRYGLKRDRILPHSVEGEREGTWIVADYTDVVLHVFTPEMRDYYRLEELWDDVPSIEHATAS